MDNYATFQRNPRQHGLGIAMVIVLHLLLWWAIQSGLTQVVTQKAKVVVDAVLLQEEKPAIPPPPAPRNLPPPPKSAPPPPAYVPPVEVPVAAPAPTQAIAAVSSTPPATVVPATMAPRAEPVRTAAAVSAANCRIDNSQDYPSASRRLEEEGTVSVRLLVGAEGRVGEVQIEKSSGFKRLDEATRALLMNPGKCTFRPATVDGKPEPSWASMKFTWRLE
jgi:protein TonB